MKYISFDTETGGLCADTTDLLTSGFVIFDENGNEVDSLELALLPQGTTAKGRGIYRVCAEALGVNKINLIEHDVKALSRDKCAEILRNFLKKHAEVLVGYEKKDLGPVYPGTGAARKSVAVPIIEIQHLQPIGHNLAGDIRFIKKQLYDNWEHYISYRNIDTAGIGRFLVDTGVLPPGKGSLGDLTKRFNIIYEAHTALGDARATGQLYFKFKELMNGSIFASPPICPR